MFSVHPKKNRFKILLYNQEAYQSGMSLENSPLTVTWSWAKVIFADKGRFSSENSPELTTVYENRPQSSTYFNRPWQELEEKMHITAWHNALHSKH